MKKIVISADSFKGTLTSVEVCEILGNAARDEFCNFEVVLVPIADGGEGTLDVFESIEGFESVEGYFTDLNGEKSLSKYLYNKTDRLAVIETAQTAGLPNSKSKDPTKTTTLGMGEQIKHAVENGAEKVIITLGGSGTNDGGAGMLHALGAKFFNEGGKEFIPVGGTLKNIAMVDLTGLERYKKIRFTAMCDVDNPPFGENGATYVYGRQKGATEDQLSLLDDGVKNLTELLSKVRGEELSTLKGGGAAGGLGLAIYGALGGELKKGIEVAMELAGLEKQLEDADVLITGEGKLDEQSFMGKVVDGVSCLAKAHGVPVVVIAGAVDVFDKEILKDNGIVAAFPTVNKAIPFEEIKPRSKDNLKRTAESVFSLMHAFSRY